MLPACLQCSICILAQIHCCPTSHQMSDRNGCLPSIHASIYSLTHSLTHSPVHSFTHSFIHSFVLSFVHLFVPSLIHSFIDSSICSFIHSSTHSFVKACGADHDHLTTHLFFVFPSPSLFFPSPSSVVTALALVCMQMVLRLVLPAVLCDAFFLLHVVVMPAFTLWAHTAVWSPRLHQPQLDPILPGTTLLFANSLPNPI